MNVGILGLGLIGGSLARAYALEGHQVFACEKDESMLSFAKEKKRLDFCGKICRIIAGFSWNFG